MLRRARTTTRFAAIVLFVAGLVAAQLAQLSHFLLVRHALCEHGDLVHAAASASPRGGDEDDAKPQAGAGSRGASEHEHCDANAVRAQIPSAEIVAAPPATLTFLLVDHAVTEDASRALDVLDVAPKSSPPTA